ncbi:MAG: helix-turn-helix transcriptional regulator [Clostridia bacterium]|nr:helix-turn-helix transcriptional regulator [Clostridia bacterium]
MFWETFVSLCTVKGISPNGACAELGLSNATATKWKNGATPRNNTLKKVADYFGVSVDYLLGNVPLDLQRFAEKEKEPTVTVDPKLLSLIDSMSAEELADLERYAEFILSRKKGD